MNVINQLKHRDIKSNECRTLRNTAEVLNIGTFSDVAVPQRTEKSSALQCWAYKLEASHRTAKNRVRKMSSPALTHAVHPAGYDTLRSHSAMTNALWPLSSDFME